MKKLLTLLSTVAIALTLSAPAFAQKGGKNRKKEATRTTSTEKSHSKRHLLHAKKKGATEGKKEGQKGKNPGPTK